MAHFSNLENENHGRGDNLMTVKLWKQNRTDQEWKISVSGLVERFMKSKGYGDKDRMDYYGPESLLNSFIGRKDGLNSSIEQSDFKKVLHCLLRVRQEKRKAKR